MFSKHLSNQGWPATMTLEDYCVMEQVQVSVKLQHLLMESSSLKKTGTLMFFQSNQSECALVGIFFFNLILPVKRTLSQERALDFWVLPHLMVTGKLNNKQILWHILILDIIQIKQETKWRKTNFCNYKCCMGFLHFLLDGKLLQTSWHGDEEQRIFLKSIPQHSLPPYIYLEF